MRILVDCSCATVGGGVSTALAFLENTANTPDFEWHAAISETVGMQVSKEIRNELRSCTIVPSSSRLQKFLSQRRLSQIEEAVHPDIVVTVFGPSYCRFSSPHFQGFAHPILVYPEYSPATRYIQYEVREYFINLYKKYLIHHADFLYVETEIMRQRVKDYLGFPLERIFLVRASYTPLFYDSMVALPPKIPQGVFSILVPAGYALHKNLEIIPKVAKSLRDMVKKEFEFVLTLPAAGIGWNRINSICKKNGTCALVRTVGFVNHRSWANLYRAADAVFLPSLLESSTAVYPESFMAGVPLATSDIDFAHSLCGDAAIYFDPYDHVSAAEALAKLLTDQPTHAKLIANGFEVLHKNYPTPAEKWQEQLRCMCQILASGKNRKG